MRFVCLLFALCMMHSAHAGIKRALIIGIDSFKVTDRTPAAYARTNEHLQNPLNGCVNDARAVKQVLTSRFGFLPQNIDTLINSQATREGIINGLNNMISKCDPSNGDMVFIYFAGHGSRVRNSLSYDSTGWDQTIVPADLWDIRNKDLSEYFNRLLDRGVTLTLFFDCCHSAAIARGSALPVMPVTREIPSIDFDTPDARAYTPPEDRGALVFSAAQRDQYAQEIIDDEQIHWGAFTFAFVNAIRNTATNESAQTIFTRIVSIIKSRFATGQDPVLGGNKARRNSNLIGEPLQEGDARTIVGVQEIIDGYVRLNGGYELGIYKGTQLVGSGGHDTLEVDTVAGIGASLAHVINGNANAIKAGNIFEMINFVAPDHPNLLLWMPASKKSSKELIAEIKPVLELFDSHYYTAVDDSLRRETAAYVIEYVNDHWQINEPGSTEPVIPEGLSKPNIQKYIPKKASVQLLLPVTQELESFMRKHIGAGSENSAIEFTADCNRADYMVAGRAGMNKNLQYALVRPNAHQNDSMLILPVRSDWIPADPASACADSLTLYAVRLGKVAAWMRLTSPPDAEHFPYHLGFIHNDGRSAFDGDTVYKGDTLELLLLLDRVDYYQVKREPRYIYIFAIDQTGQMSLLYPKSSLGEQVPIQPVSQQIAKDTIRLLRNKKGNPARIWVTEPFGYDTYFMLTSKTPLPTDIFTSKGVLTRSAMKGPETPLERLLKNNGTTTRGQAPAITTDPWSIEKLHLYSSAKKPTKTKK